MFAEIMAHHDYVWARVPFLAPMGAAIARRRTGTGAEEVARRIRGLGALLLEHLGAEERLLTRRGAASAADWVGQGMIGDHLMIMTALDEIRDAVARWSEPDRLECRLSRELELLDEHVHAQIALEEALVAARLDAPAYTPWSGL
ncbi:MAG TPA: hemerythrin domain-containing protein [Kofleriaceae bacterium]